MSDESGIIYSNSPNVQVPDENGVLRRANLVAIAPGEIVYQDNEKSTNVQVMGDDGNLHRAQLVAVIGGAGGDQHNLGYYADQEALEEAHPTAEAGDWAIVGETDTVWIWDEDTTAWVDSDRKGQVTSVNNQTGDVTVQETLVSGTNIKTVNNESILGGGNITIDSLPTQTGNAGKVLTTDGTNASWVTVNALQNTATGANGVGIVGTSSGSKSVVLGETTNDNGAGANVLIGYGAKANNWTASYAIGIGFSTKVGSEDAIAIGDSAESTAKRAVSIGHYAKATAQYAIQIGGTAATNSDTNTFKVANANGNFEIMSADGTIPTARLTKVNSTITLTVAGWSSNTQTVNVTGMTATGVVLVSPDPTDQADYTSAGIICSAQAAGTLTFTCSTTPAADLSVNVVML